MQQTWWSEFRFSAMEFRKNLVRDQMLRRYQKWSQGQIPWEDQVFDSIVKTRTQVVTSWRAMIKRSLDVVLSALGIVFLAPVMAVITLAVKLESKGPVLYRQTRVGLKGRNFTIYKFRTMVQDAESSTGPVWARKNDSRITRLGAFLRKTHLDEIPQLINVLRGEMSIVGPRPERPHFVTQFRSVIPHYERRLCAKPGITGLAQIRQHYDETIKDVKKKVRYDVLYIQKMCPLLDVKVMALTAVEMLMRTGR